MLLAWMPRLALRLLSGQLPSLFLSPWAPSSVASFLRAARPLSQSLVSCKGRASWDPVVPKEVHGYEGAQKSKLGANRMRV